MKILNLFTPLAGGLWLIPILLLLAAGFSFYKAKAREAKGFKTGFAYMASIVFLVAAIATLFFMMTER